MTLYTLTTIDRTDGTPPRPRDADKLGKQFRILSLKAGESAVLLYADDPTWTLWTPEVTYVHDPEPIIIDVRVLADPNPRTEVLGEVLSIECEGITYEFQSDGKEGN